MSRRNALGGAATIGLGLPLLAACGDDGGGDAASDPSQSPSSSTPASETPPTKKARPANGIATTSEIPVGSGIVLADDEVVITQPSEGEFKAFSAICTHQGCTVTGVSDGTINCTCHGSRFSIADGSVQAGPAPQPLPARDVAVEGDSIVLA